MAGYFIIVLIKLLQLSGLNFFKPIIIIISQYLSFLVVVTYCVIVLI